MNIDEARRNKALHDLGQRLDELVLAHNTFFKQTNDDSIAIWEQLGNFLVDIDELQKDTSALRHSILTQSKQVGDLNTKAKGISERISDIEARQKDSEADLKRLQRDFSSYQIGCGRTIIEIQMRLERLESEES